MSVSDRIKTVYRYSKAACKVLRRPFVPPYVIYFITSRCNAGCDYCHFKEQMADPSRLSGELKIHEIEKIARNFGRIIKLSLCGGEPFLREDIDDIVQLWVKHTRPLIVDIPTNGSLPERIYEKCERILRKNPDITLDIQLSVDGTGEVHDAVRKFPGLYQRAIETYKKLVGLRKHFPNLKVKLNLVYLPENESNLLEAMHRFIADYEFDRVQITFPHGRNIADTHINRLNFYKFFKLTRSVLKSKVRSRFDVHTMVFRSVKLVRDELLLKALKARSMGAFCRSGKSLIVLGDEGSVYPCEPMWYKIGNLREHDYDVKKILASKRMKEFYATHHGYNKCHCLWGSAALASIVQEPRYLFKIAYYFLYLFVTGGKKSPGHIDLSELEQSDE